MSDSLAARLESVDRRPTVTALPDGSVDRFCEVYDGDRRIRRREAFAREVRTGHSPAFQVRPTAVEPGGHATNMATQADLLGADSTLVGHVDDPVFAMLPFETVSLGDPAAVDVYQFDDGDVLLADPSAGAADWSLPDLRAATGDAFESLLTADVAFWTNWTTFGRTPRALERLARAGLDGDYLLFDPGSLSTRSDGAIRRLFGALAALSGSYDVILAVNGGEARSLAAALDGRDADRGATGRDDGAAGPSDGDADLGRTVERVEAAADVEAVVVHEATAAVAATPEGRVRVENHTVDPVRHTGGGDRFDAGLGHALALGWSWEDALRLGNACASRYVATARSGTVDELAAFLRGRE